MVHLALQHRVKDKVSRKHPSIRRKRPNARVALRWLPINAISLRGLILDEPAKRFDLALPLQVSERRARANCCGMDRNGL